MQTDHFSEIRQDCLLASAAQPDVRAKFASRHIAVTGGTGFLGSWIAETIAALNDEYQLGITLHLYARNINDWVKKYPHLSGRKDFVIRSQDIRSSFEFHPETSYVIHAAGVPNGRIHSSDPLRVQQTTVAGLNNVLEAASQLDNLQRLLNVSSCLANGFPNRPGALHENEYFALPCGQLHTIYAESKRAAESLAAIYRSQYRMRISTVRPFTFAGPYQELDRPWAINSFMRDVLTGSDIRIHGDGKARRSYLYGSDAAWWTLAALANGEDGQIYNIGSAEPISHIELVAMINDHVSPKSRIVLNTAQSKQQHQDDLFPDTAHTQKQLGVTQSCTLQKTIDKTWRWYASKVDR